MALIRLPMSEGRALLDAAAQKKLGANVKTRGGRRPAHKRGVMNKLEAAWAKVLDDRRLAGHIKTYYFEQVTLLLADGVRYTPDFFIVLPDDTIEINETKGFMRDDARIKLRVAANSYRHFRFFLVTKPKGQNWSREPVMVLG